MSSSEPEKNDEVSSPASTSWKGKWSGTNAPKRFNVTGASRPVKVLEALLWTFEHAPKQGNSTQLKVSPAPPNHRPQSLTSLSEPEKNDEVSSPASTSWKGKRSGTNAAKRFNVTSTRGTGTNRPVKVLGSLVVDLRKRSGTGKQHPTEGFTGTDRSLIFWTGESPASTSWKGQRKWHQYAKEVQCGLNQRNWHQQASEGLGKLCCGPLETLWNRETAPSWRFHRSLQTTDRSL